MQLIRVVKKIPPRVPQRSQREKKFKHGPEQAHPKNLHNIQHHPLPGLPNPLSHVISIPVHRAHKHLRLLHLKQSKPEPAPHLSAPLIILPKIISSFGFRNEGTELYKEQELDCSEGGDQWGGIRGQCFWEGG